MHTDRDRWGVPHLRASDHLSLARLQGRNAATDRPGQLTLEAARAAGRSGEPSWDAIAREALLVETAQRCWDALEPDVAAWVAAYVEGVDEVLDGWEPWTPLSVWLSHHLLFGGLASDLWRTAAAEAVGDELVDLLRSDGGHPAGSNGWLLSGRRTASGLPLLAGDPHRVLEDPGVYQQIRLTCDEYDVVGLAVPGVPGVPHFGHAGPVAWGITNASADYQDLAPDETWDGPRFQGLALRTPTWDLRACGFDALPRLLRARTVADVDAAMGRWVEPVNVVLAADSQGGLLHRVAGQVPARRITGRVRTSLGWQGWRPNPSRPVDEIAVMANERGLSDGLGWEYAHPHRARRIREILEARDDWTPADMAVVHTDVVHAPSALLDLLPDGCPLAAWDRRMAVDSVDAATFAQLRHLVVQALSRRPELAPLFEIACPTTALEPWYDATRRLGFAVDRLLQHFPEGEMRALVADCWSRVEPGPTWGEVHRLAPWELVPSGTEWPTAGGDHLCVLCTSSVPGSTDRFGRGSVARWVWDLADRDASRWVVPFGAREGDRDQLPSWVAGDLIPVVSEDRHA